MVGSIAAAYLAYKATRGSGRVIETAAYEAQVEVGVASEGMQNTTRRASDGMEQVIQATSDFLTLSCAFRPDEMASSFFLALLQSVV